MHSILIVDDEPHILFALEDFLSSGGMTVTTASELEEAQALVATRSFDAIIADLRLSGSDGTEGLELARFVREVGPETPLVLLTAYGTPALQAAAERLGARFVSKPQPLEVISRLVSQLIGERRLRDAAG